MHPIVLDTIDVCVIWYDPGNKSNIVINADFIKKVNTCSKQLFPVFGEYFIEGLLLKTTSNTNYSQNRKQVEKEHEKQMDNHPRNWRRKKSWILKMRVLMPYLVYIIARM